MSRSEAVTGPSMMERHYRVTLDFKLLVREITSEVCRQSFFFNDRDASADEPFFHEHIERQRRLYHLLLANEPVLEQFLLSILVQDAGSHAYEGLADAFATVDEEELLVALYRGMDAEDARFFEECRADGTLAENTELLDLAIQVKWVGSDIAEMRRVVSGDIKRAEIVEETRERLIKKLNSLPHRPDADNKMP